MTNRATVPTVKVLYSLDDLLPNCLARAKDVVYVRVAHLDESTPIGFVDLKTCVLNLVYSRFVTYICQKQLRFLLCQP